MVDCEGAFPQTDGDRGLNPLVYGGAGSGNPVEDVPPSRLQCGTEGLRKGAASKGVMREPGNARSPRHGRRAHGRAPVSFSKHQKGADLGSSSTSSPKTVRSTISSAGKVGRSVEPPPFGRTIPYEKYIEAIERLELTKAYGRKVSEANKRATKRIAVRASHHTKSFSFDGCMESIREDELWRSRRKARKADPPYDTETMSQTNSCLEPFCGRDDRLREWVTHSAFVRPASPTITAHRSLAGEHSDTGTPMKNGSVDADIAMLNFQNWLNVRSRMEDKGVQATHGAQGVLAPWGTKFDQGWQEHGSSDSKRTGAAAASGAEKDLLLGCPRGRGSFRSLHSSQSSAESTWICDLMEEPVGAAPCKQKAGVQAACQTDEELVKTFPGASSRSGDVPKGDPKTSVVNPAVQHRTPRVYYIMPRKCWQCAAHRRKRKKVRKKRSKVVADPEKRSTIPDAEEGKQCLAAVSSETIGNGADAGLASRVESLREVVSHKREEARLLELQLEEMLLLQESDMLDTYIARSSRMLQDLNRASIAFDGSCAQQPAQLVGRDVVEDAAMSKHTDLGHGSCGVVDLVKRSDMSEDASEPPEALVGSMGAQTQQQSDLQKLHGVGEELSEGNEKPEHLLECKEHFLDMEESGGVEGRTSVSAKDKQGAFQVTDSRCRDSFRKTLSPILDREMRPTSSDCATVHMLTEATERKLECGEMTSYAFDKDLQDLLEQDFPITAEDLTEERDFVGGDSDDTDDRFHPPRQGAVARLGMAPDRGFSDDCDKEFGYVGDLSGLDSEMETASGYGKDKDENFVHGEGFRDFSRKVAGSSTHGFAALMDDNCRSAGHSARSGFEDLLLDPECGGSAANGAGNGKENKELVMEQGGSGAGSLGEGCSVMAAEELTRKSKHRNGEGISGVVLEEGDNKMGNQVGGPNGDIFDNRTEQRTVDGELEIEAVKVGVTKEGLELVAQDPHGRDVEGNTSQGPQFLDPGKARDESVPNTVDLAVHIAQESTCAAQHGRNQPVHKILKSPAAVAGTANRVVSQHGTGTERMGLEQAEEEKMVVKGVEAKETDGCFKLSQEREERELGSIEEQMMQQMMMHEPIPRLMEPGDLVNDNINWQKGGLVREPAGDVVGSLILDQPKGGGLTLPEEEVCRVGEFEREEVNGQAGELWVGFVSTDLEYIGKFVEDVMGYFLREPPESVNPFGSCVPEECFKELQATKPDCIKEQSVFDRCIFEAVADAVASVYRRCNRVENGASGEAERLPLPDESLWIHNVKQQVLRAADQPPGSDLVEALLVQDAWALQRDLLNLDDELQ